MAVAVAFESESEVYRNTRASAVEFAAPAVSVADMSVRYCSCDSILAALEEEAFLACLRPCLSALKAKAAFPFSVVGNKLQLLRCRVALSFLTRTE